MKFRPRPEEDNSRRNGRQQKGILILAVALLSAASIILTLVIALRPPPKIPDFPIPLCISKDCTVAASSLITSMDETHDPCNDFYSYVCANYIKVTPELTTHFVEGSRLLKLQVRELMGRPNSPNDPSAVIKARTAYKFCLATTDETSSGIDSLKTVVEDLGGWPMADSKWSPYSTIEKLIAKIENMGLTSGLFKLSVTPDPVNPDIKRITLDEPNDDDKVELRQKRENKVEEKRVTEYIENTVRALGGKETTDQIRAYTEEMIIVTGDLTSILSPQEDRRNQSRMYNEMSIKNLNELTNHTFDWFALLQLVYGNENVKDENALIIVKEVDYICKLPEVLSGFSNRTITNYVLWEVISHLLNYVINTSTDRWQNCLKDISEGMSFAMWRIVADDMVTNETVEYVEELISDLKQSYNEMIGNSEWLDDKTKENTLKKLNGMQEMVGYPKWVKEDDQLNSFYENFIITTDHFTNMVTAKRLSHQRKVRDLRKPVDRKEWLEVIRAIVANAFYDYSSNTMYIPAGILQPPFYSSKRSQSLNYGAIGSIIGHEIGHAFDNDGSQMDERGAFREWQTKEGHEMYNKRNQCYKDQYDTYCFNETQFGGGKNKTCLDGGLTLRENLPDNTGTLCAYKAYLKWIKKHGREKPLPGLVTFSSEKLFFISYATVWCETVTPLQWVTYGSTHSHSPGIFRVQGTLSNMEAFSREFNCSAGPMNRGQNKCSFW